MSSTSPTVSKDMLIFVSRLSSTEKTELFTSVFQRDDLRRLFTTAVHEVALHRLIRADECLRIAQNMLACSGEEELRTAIGRAYYSIHHSIRAVVLREREYDPDGHQESIEVLAELLKDNSFRARSGLQADDGKNVVLARDNRLVADYSPFDESRFPNGNTKIELSHSNWADAAKFNVDLGKRLLVASMKVVGVS